jgi:hypothetical protein
VQTRCRLITLYFIEKTMEGASANLIGTLFVLSGSYEKQNPRGKTVSISISLAFPAAIVLLGYPLDSPAPYRLCCRL